MISVPFSVGAFNQQKLSAFFVRQGGFWCVLLAFFTPISISLTALSIVFMMGCFLLSGDWSYKRSLFSHPVLMAAMLLCAWLLLGNVYTLSFELGIKNSLKYFKVLLIWPLFYFLKDNPKLWRWMIKALVVSCLINLVLIFVNFYLLPEEKAISFSSRVWPAAKGHFEFAYFMMIFAFASFLQGFAKKASKKERLICFMLSLTALFATLILNTSRTGYVLFLAIMAVSFVIQFNKKGVILTLILGAIAVFSVYHSSETIQTRVEVIKKEYAEYQTGESNKTSIAHRLYLLQSIYDLLKANPERLVAGFGTGSLPVASKNIQLEKAQNSTNGFDYEPVVNPHNQYLLLLCENGLIGVFLFLNLMLAVFKCAKSQPIRSYLLATAVVTCMVVGCLFNSWLRDFGPALLFLLFSSLVISRPKLNSI